MKIISMHKVDAAMEAGKLPSPELIQGMGQLMGEMRRASAFVDGDGLRQSHTRARVRVKGAGPGPRQGTTVERGPYAGGNELVERLTRIRVKDMEEGIAWAARQAEATGAEVEVGPITEGWDLGLMAKPAQAPLRCLLLQKGDPASESDRSSSSSSSRATAALGGVTADMERAGVLLTPPTRLRPSREGKRISVAGGKPVFRDGPFAESKELIAGFVLLDVPGMPDAVEWALRFAKVIGDVEIELRPLDVTA
jgi:hypothetical protein